MVEEHFHPKSTEYFTILAGEMRFTLNGVEHVVRKEDGIFVIPRGVVHTVRSPKGMHTEFKVRGDHDLVEERDFLIQMFTLVETVSGYKFYFRAISWADHLQRDLQNQFGLLKRYTCFYRSGNFVPKFSYLPKTFGSILVWLLGGVFGTFLGLGKADLKKD